MSVYGLSIECFPELFVTVEYFNQDPKINAGFENKTTPQEIRVIFQSTGNRAVKDNNDNIVYVNKKEIWCSTELQPGYFISQGEDVYRISQENNWFFEDGFYKYGIDKVVGDDGSLTNEPDYNLGESFQ